jgi:hypothetical protein
LTFAGVPDILPVERISEYTLGEIESNRVKNLQKEGNKDVVQRPKEELANISNFNYETAKEPDRKDFLARFKLIRKKKITYPKKLAAIFNP